MTRENIDIRTSYTAADSIPLKVLLDKELVDSIHHERKILPIHIQLLPTNKCNMNCPFCSCSERDKNLEMDYELVKQIIDKFKKEGSKSVTITGGGEPILYPHFGDMINYLDERNIKVGLVTNGLLLHTVDKSVLRKMVWCRISNGDDRTFSDQYRSRLEKVITDAPDVDWAFSHVISDKPNLDEIARVVQFANQFKFTHVRLVADLYQPEEIDMNAIRQTLGEMGIDDKLVIYQGRKAYDRGGDCYICYLKPLIGPDAKLYACCGVQYALETPGRDFPEELCLGDAIDIDKIIANSHSPFNGSVCAKCYYNNYNILLKGMLKEVAHREFV
jgi:organic radical activating enzyme